MPDSFIRPAASICTCNTPKIPANRLGLVFTNARHKPVDDCPGQGCLLDNIEGRLPDPDDELAVIFASGTMTSVGQSN
jgi:hypothetical protein